MLCGTMRHNGSYLALLMHMCLSEMCSPAAPLPPLLIDSAGLCCLSPLQVFTPSVFGEVSLVSVAAASGAAAATASTGSVAQARDASAAAEDSAASGPAGGRVEEFTAAQRAQRGKGPAAAPAVADLADAEQPMEEQAPPPTELELR